MNIHRLIVFAALLTACSSTTSKKSSTVVWDRNLPVIGSQSSPRTADLNKDGTLDIVIGAGKNEYQHSDMGILAFDGKTGNILWKQDAPDQVYGSATLYDVTGDGIEDVFIGGRSPQLKAIDGRSGSLLWEYKYDSTKKDPILHNAHFNFSNSVVVKDQNKNGYDDLMIINGGNSYAQPYSRVGRFPAVLMLIDTKTGDVIAADTMPDGKESYMTPLAFTQPVDKEQYIIFGTGGETIDGSLYIATLADLVSKNLSRARVIASDTGHGFIAPATLADITNDGYLDIVAISHGSKTVAIDGKDYHTIWTRTFPGTECSNSFAAGYFTDDEVPDFFTFISRGLWPNSTGSLQVMVDGRNGEVKYMDSIGCTGFSSPVVYDLNNDGTDEAILSVNEFDCSLGYASKAPAVMENKLIYIDFAKKTNDVIDHAKGFKNVFTTPWIGDLDNDGYLDLVHCQYYHHGDLLLFLGMKMKRIDLPIKIRKNVLWGAYLGSKGNGVFMPEN
jgi:outer membrane protein assembly factor BamB